MNILHLIGNYLNGNVDTNVYQIPGILAYLHNPQKGLNYITQDNKAGILVSLILTLVCLIGCILNFEEYLNKSSLLVFSIVWMIVINLIAFVPKLFVYYKLRKIDEKLPKAEIR